MNDKKFNKRFYFQKKKTFEIEIGSMDRSLMTLFNGGKVFCKTSIIIFSK